MLHVTGATGYLGSELTRLRPDASTERVEVRDPSSRTRRLFERVRPEVVIHTAYRQDGPDAYTINVDGSLNVARAAAGIGARLVHVSTVSFFDGAGKRRGITSSSDEPSPVTEYGRTKAQRRRRTGSPRAHPPGARSYARRSSTAVAEPLEARARGPRSGNDVLHQRDSLSVQVGDLAAALLELAAFDLAGPLTSPAPTASPVPSSPSSSPGGRSEGLRRRSRPLDCRLDSSAARGVARDAAARCAGGPRVNRLADETSPYLLQHADNPVDWYPWGDEALARAARRTGRSCSRSATPPATGAT